MIFKDYLKQNKKLIDTAILKYIPSSGRYAALLCKAIKYSMFPGGKRIRPLLTLFAYKACGGRGKEIMPFACAIEMVHTSFLIHDDLPSLDNDSFRRGRPAVHKKFDEATAVLTGDALLIKAFSIMCEGKTNNRKIEAIDEISKAIGVKGVVGGQAAEIENRLFRGRKAPRKSEIFRDSVLGISKKFQRAKNKEKMLEYIHKYKTASLIKAAVKVGAIIASAEKRKVDSLSKFGNDLGMSFQLIDDILDNDGLVKILGKEKVKSKAVFLTKRAKKHLDIFGERADSLKEIADFCFNRK